MIFGGTGRKAKYDWTRILIKEVAAIKDVQIYVFCLQKFFRNSSYLILPYFFLKLTCLLSI